MIQFPEEIPMRLDRAFYRSFFSLYVVLVLQNVVTISVNLADNIMLGSYSETSLAGAAAVNQIQFVYQQLLLALGDGLVIFGSQYWGKKRLEPLKKIAASAMHAGLLIGLLLFAAVSLWPSGVLRLFTDDKPIVAEGVRYLGIIRFSYLFFAVTQLLLAALRSVETVKIAFCLSVLTLCVNCGINYLLIFGHLGFPELGIAGAAAGTLTARILEMCVLLFYIRKKEPVLRLRLRDYLHADPGLARDYLKVTAPMLLTQGLWGVNTALQTVILGHMTAAAIAANSAASTLFLLVKSTAVGAASTASVLIGKAIGAGDIPRTKLCARRLQRMFCIIGLLSGITLFFIRIPVLSLYDLQPATKAMANTFLIILSVVCVGMSYQMPTNNGIIRGGGSASFVVKMDLISIWGIVLPLSFFMAFVVKASPAVVVCCLNADQIFKCVPAFVKSNYGSWIRQLTRD
ncbi:MAG: MATE family efflux transporter [Eubacteriales bacterium]|nr:MATE family efflux transporter [Eubacteriales bacterium]